MTKQKFAYIILCEQEFIGGVLMITTLHIKNIGIIDDLTIDFNEGFNVLTGETGAGKTLIVGALRNYFRW